MEQPQAEQRSIDDAQILQGGHHQRRAARVGARHAPLAQRGKDPRGRQQPGRAPFQQRKPGKQQGTHQSHQRGAERKIEHRARLGFTGTPQRAHLQIGQRRHHSRNQSQQGCQRVIACHARIEQQHHAHKTAQHRHEQPGIGNAPRLPPCSHDHQRTQPDTAHGVECHRGGKRQMPDRVEPQRHRRDARHIAPNMQQRHGSGQRSAAQPEQGAEQHHPRQPAVEHDLQRAIARLRRQLDAHPHDGEEQGAERHPEGLHEETAE